MKKWILFSILMMFSAGFFAGCGQSESEDSVEQFLKKQASEAALDDAITIVDEAVGVNETMENDEIITDVISRDDNVVSEDLTEAIIGETAEKERYEVSEEEKRLLQDDKPVRKDKTTSFKSRPVAYMRMLVEKGRYKEAYEKKIDAKSAGQLYYKGIAAYCLYQTSGNKRYIPRAVKYTKKAAVVSKNKEFKSKAVLWHGMLLYKYRRSGVLLSELLKPFNYIQKYLRQTRCYNDSLLYEALVYNSKKKYRDALACLRQLEKQSDSDLIYDIEYKKWVKPSSAARHYISFISHIPKDRGSENFTESYDYNHDDTEIPEDDATEKPESLSDASDESEEGIYSESMKSFIEQVQKTHNEIASSERNNLQTNSQVSSQEAADKVSEDDLQRGENGLTNENESSSPSDETRTDMDQKNDDKNMNDSEKRQESSGTETKNGNADDSSDNDHVSDDGETVSETPETGDVEGATVDDLLDAGEL